MFRQKLIHYTITGSLAGLLVGILDTVQLFFAHDMFFDSAEMARAVIYTLFADIALGISLLFILALGVVLPKLLIKKVDLQKPRLFYSTLISAIVFGPALFAVLRITSGPQASQMNGRYAITVIAALISSLATGFSLGYLPSFLKRKPERIAVFTTVSTLLAIALQYIDSTVLVRLYPLFHYGLTFLTLVVLAGAISLALQPIRRKSSQAILSLLMGVLLGCGTGTLWSIFNTQNVRFVIRQHTGAATDIIALSGGVFSSGFDVDSSEQTKSPGKFVVSSKLQITMPGADLFLVTIDAMRYDRLKRTGASHSIMPNLDRLVENSALFTRGYSPVPHTSYAVTSLLTGKYTKPLFNVPGAPLVHETWPEILRRFRYETSAFFPPAVFFIDKAKFEPYYKKGVGFLYKHVDARVSPKEKVALLIDHVKMKKKTGRPHFSWIHFFEAHEPYDPDCTKFGNSPENRYDCELNTVDEAFGDLVNYINKENPNSLLIVTADHGEAFGEHGDRYHGTSLHDEQVRVPIVINGPKIPHKVIDAPVSIVDLLGTAFRILDVPVPARVRSRDISSLLVEDHAFEAFSEAHDDAMIVTDTHKLICNIKTDLCRLYDLNTDPRERRSIAESKPELVAQLKQRLLNWLSGHARFELKPIADETRQSTEKWPLAIQQALAGDTHAVSKLPSVIKSSNVPEIRRKAAELIYRMSSTFPSELANTINAEKDEIVAAWLIALKVKMGDRSFGPKLFELSKTIIDESALARQISLTQLASGDTRAVPRIMQIALLESAPIEDRRYAVELLGRFKEGEIASTRLIPLIDNYQLTLVVAETLGKLSCNPAVTALVARLKRERFPERKAVIVDALAQIGDWRAVPTVSDHLNLDPPLPNVLAAFEKLVRPSPNGRKIPSARKDQRVLFFHPVKSLYFRYHFKNTNKIFVRTKQNKESGELSVTCNNSLIGTIDVTPTQQEYHLDIRECQPLDRPSPYHVRISKNGSKLDIESVVIVGE